MRLSFLSICSNDLVHPPRAWGPDILQMKMDDPIFINWITWFGKSKWDLEIHQAFLPYKYEEAQHFELGIQSTETQIHQIFLIFTNANYCLLFLCVEIWGVLGVRDDPKATLGEPTLMGSSWTGIHTFSQQFAQILWSYFCWIVQAVHRLRRHALSALMCVANLCANSLLMSLLGKKRKHLPIRPIYEKKFGWRLPSLRWLHQEQGRKEAKHRVSR